MCENLKSIGFTPSLAEQVLRGAKKSTYRLGDKYTEFTQGERVYVNCSDSSHSFAIVEISKILRIRLRDIPLNRPGHKTYATRDELRKDLQSHYDEVITDDTCVWVIDFTVIQILK